jgi:polysaccharide export outer membrane protein
LPAALLACAGPNAADSLPRGQAAYAVVPAAPPPAAPYRIAVADRLDITVTQEAELSAKAAGVDAAGQVAVPGVGAVAAAGHTPDELARAIEARMRAHYLRHPEVSVAVVEAASQKVVVEGEGREPGTYPLKGPTTLLEALSLARGETRVAALKEVLVFRVADGKARGAVFDVNRIRRGDAPDPVVRGQDRIVVGYSNKRGWWRDFLAASPLVAAARPIL